MSMQFRGLQPLKEGFPHIELQADDFCFDLHNAATLDSVSYDYAAHSFTAKWRVRNLLPHGSYGPYRSAVVVLSVDDVESLHCSGTIHEAANQNENSFDFLEYSSRGASQGVLRIVFIDGGEIAVTGNGCEMRYFLE